MNIFDEIYKINAYHPEKTAMSMAMDNADKISFTYGEIFSEAQLLADKLLKSGVRAGDRIAIAAESSPYWAIAFFAVLNVILFRKQLAGIFKKNNK